MSFGLPRFNTLGHNIALLPHTGAQLPPKSVSSLFSPVRPSLTLTFASVCISAVVLLTSCGGGGSQPPPPPPPPVPDFTLSVSPAQASATLGTATAPISISVTAVNGFSGTATITLSGLPAGSTSQPPSPFTVAGGKSQSVTFNIPAASAVGIFTIQAAAASGMTSHTGQIGLTINPVITSTDDGTSFFLQTQTSTETTRVGLLQAWGAAITEVSLNGINYVNHDDPGRQIQTSLWDSNANYNTSWG
jgi:hypothetical protein